MREGSKIGGVLGSMTITIFASLLVVFNPRLTNITPFYAFRLMTAGAIFYNFRWLYSQSSHFGIMITLPTVFEVLMTTPAPDAFIKLETERFLKELKDGNKL